MDNSDSVDENSSFTRTSSKQQRTDDYPVVADVTVPNKSSQSLSMAPVFHGMVTKGQDYIVDQYHQLLHSFVNNNNISIRSVKSKDYPEWEELIWFVLHNAANLRAAGRKKVFYREYLGKDVSFISILHDILDSTQSHLLGLTVKFYNLRRRRVHLVPFGLVPVTNHLAVSVAERTLSVLDRANIKKNDLFRAVNDTTASAVALGSIYTSSFPVRSFAGSLRRSEAYHGWQSQNAYGKYVAAMKNVGRKCIKFYLLTTLELGELT
eukprot:IDg2192t1